MAQKPAFILAALPGQIALTLEIAAKADEAGFAGLYCPSFGDCLAHCLSLAHVTSKIPLATAVQPIYFRHPLELARGASYLNEVSGGRFRLGLGVSHAPIYEHYHLAVGKPLADMRRYVEAVKAAEPEVGPLPPIILATLRDKMLALAAELTDGAVFAHGSRQFVKKQLAGLPKDKQSKDFFVGAVVYAVIDDDHKAAAALTRKSLTMYLQLPNYRNCWRAAGYVEEMDAVETAIAKNDLERLPALIGDRMLEDICLFGSPTKVRDGIEAWRDAGVKTPILFPSSTRGGQREAVEELFGLYS